MKAISNGFKGNMLLIRATKDNNWATTEINIPAEEKMQEGMMLFGPYV